MRVVLDSNVIVSSYLNASGNPAAIRTAFESRTFEVIVSAQLLAEYARVLGYPRIARMHGMSAAEVNEQIEGLRQAAVVIEPSAIPNVIPEDPADNTVIATAVAGEAAFIVSGDDDLLRLGVYRGIRILTPAAFVALIAR